jgi:hypothetical protein
MMQRYYFLLAKQISIKKKSIVLIDNYVWGMLKLIVKLGVEIRKIA